MANSDADREVALKDDFQFDSGTYGYDDEDDEWGDDEATWTAEGDVEEEETTDAKDESTAYLEFLNEEVSSLSLQPTPIRLETPLPPNLVRLLTVVPLRRRSLAPARMPGCRTMSWAKTVSCSNHRSIKSSRISFSGIRS